MLIKFPMGQFGKSSAKPTEDAMPPMVRPKPEISSNVCERMLKFIDPGPYDNWYKCGMAMKEHFNGSQEEREKAREVYIIWSIRSPKSKGRKEALKKWNGFHKKETGAHYTMDNLKKDAEKAGYKSEDAGALHTLSPIRASDLVAQSPGLREPIVEGFLRRSETLNIIAASKMRKSWLAMMLALCVVMGRHWLGMMCKKGIVLYIDNELHLETIADRIKTIAQALFLGPEDYANLYILSIRGLDGDLDKIREFVRRMVIKPDLIILDAYYRTMPSGIDENSNADQTRMYNIMDSMAQSINAALVIIHHASKGSQADKSITDVGAGAGAISRAADAHVILREHEETDCVVLDAACRSFPKLEPRVLRWEFPQWKVDPTLDATRLRGKRVTTARANATKESFVVDYLLEAPRDHASILEAAHQDGISQSRAKQLLRAAVTAKLAFQHQSAGGPGRFATYATVPPAMSTLSTMSTPSNEKIVAFRKAHPKATNAEIANALNVSPKTVQRASK